MRTLAVAVIIGLFIALAYGIGRISQYRLDADIVNASLENTIQCDGIIPDTDPYFGGEYAEFDCLTPEAYEIIDDHFFNSPLSDKNLKI